MSYENTYLAKFKVPRCHLLEKGYTFEFSPQKIPKFANSPNNSTLVQNEEYHKHSDKIRVKMGELIKRGQIGPIKWGRVGIDRYSSWARPLPRLRARGGPGGVRAPTLATRKPALRTQTHAGPCRTRNPRFPRPPFSFAHLCMLVVASPFDFVSDAHNPPQDEVIDDYLLHI